MNFKYGPMQGRFGVAPVNTRGLRENDSAPILDAMRRNSEMSQKVARPISLKSKVKTNDSCY